MSINSKSKECAGLIDAYAHIGNPKFGSLANIEMFFNSLDIEKGILVLGPWLPDFKSLIEAREKLGGKIRFIGIPFGETEEQRRELCEFQIKLGISGMRFMPFELMPNKALIDRLGEEGLWLFPINPYTSNETAEFLLDWLERYPLGKIASPHFLLLDTMIKKVKEMTAFRKLLRHPRFYAILSRQGGVGSLENYPHRDLLPFVKEMVKEMTWKRLMWGSEFPVFYQRNEQPEQVRDWLLRLDIELTEAEKEDFYRNNALRCFFSSDIKKCEEREIPEWVGRQVDWNSKVYLFPSTSLYLPMEDYNVLLTDYQEILRINPDFTFAEYIEGKLSDAAADIRRDKIL